MAERQTQVLPLRADARPHPGDPSPLHFVKIAVDPERCDSHAVFGERAGLV